MNFITGLITSLSTLNLFVIPSFDGLNQLFTRVIKLAPNAAANINF